MCVCTVPDTIDPGLDRAALIENSNVCVCTVPDMIDPGLDRAGAYREL